MRQLLNSLYCASGVLAAMLMVTIASVVLAQIMGRFLGFLVPSAGEIAGYSVAASAFLALAPTLQHGNHIRVTLLLEQLPRRLQRWVELWCLAVAFGLSVYYIYCLAQLVSGSFQYGDVSPGLLAIPLWIPQLAMVVGTGIFALALLDNLVTVLFTDRDPAYRSGQQPGAAE